MKIDEEIVLNVERIVGECGAQFFEAKFFLSGKIGVFRVFADTKTGITLDECANISKKVSDYLDSVDFGKGEYNLEVSSPGIARLLVTAKDFERVIGKNVGIRFRGGNEKLQKKIGVIKSADDKKVVFESGEEIDFSSILNGKIIFDL
jgi:ribosome maturation factor RimP